MTLFNVLLLSVLYSGNCLPLNQVLVNSNITNVVLVSYEESNPSEENDGSKIKPGDGRKEAYS